MKKIFEDNGIVRLELENGETAVPDSCFSWTRRISEVHIPEGVTEIGTSAFTNCHDLRRVYFPSSLKVLGDKLFYGLESMEIYYSGSADAFRELATPYKKKVYVQVSGPYDRQPYCITEGTYYEEREEWQSFDSFCRYCQVICHDGQRLYYGYGNLSKKSD